MRRRGDRCCNGHDLTLPNATYRRPYDGYEECRRCKAMSVERWRKRQRGEPEPVRREASNQPDEPIPPDTDLDGVDSKLQRAVDEENLPAYLKPHRKLMWPADEVEAPRKR